MFWQLLKICKCSALLYKKKKKKEKRKAAEHNTGEPRASQMLSLLVEIMLTVGEKTICFQEEPAVNMVHGGSADREK